MDFAALERTVVTREAAARIAPDTWIGLTVKDPAGFGSRLAFGPRFPNSDFTSAPESAESASGKLMKYYINSSPFPPGLILEKLGCRGCYRARVVD